MVDTYRSIERPAEGIFRDRNSRFLAFGYPVNTIGQITELLAGLRKEYHDARHHCYAYRLGFTKDVIRMNDDGEPSGTAGKPIYGQLLTYDLTDILAVVVRYFGGTLLGTAGLINAYRQATANMLTHANVIEKFMEVSFRIGFPYDGLNKVMQVLKEEGIIPVHPEYNLRCSMDIRVRKSLSERISARLSVISGMTLESVSGSD